MTFQEKYKEILSSLILWHFKAKANGEKNPYFHIWQYQEKAGEEKNRYLALIDVNASISCFEITFWEKEHRFAIYVEGLDDAKVSTCLQIRDTNYGGQSDLFGIVQRHAYKKLSNSSEEIYKKNYDNWEDAFAYFIENEKTQIDVLRTNNSLIVRFIQEDVFYENISEYYKIVYPYSGYPYLHALYIADYQDIKETFIDALPPTKWIFLTGENGMGKTSVLQAIALGLCGDEAAKQKIGTISFCEKYHLNDFPKENLIGYGANRLLLQSTQSSNSDAQNSTNLYNLFHSDGNLKNIEYELKRRKFAQNKQLIAEYHLIEKTLTSIIPQLHHIEYEEVEDTVYYVEQDENGNTYKAVTFEQLATGLRGLVALVGDILVRFLKIGTIKDTKEIQGIVIIDELDAHLHPIMQKKIPKLLSTAFPNVQFIASTHSPIPLLDATSETIILHVNRSTGAGVVLERIVLDNIETLNPNILLTSPIFGFSDIINDNLANFQAYKTENSLKEVEENKQNMQDLIALYKERVKLLGE